MAVVAPTIRSIRYDGTNGSFIAGTFNTAITFVSDNGTTFVFQDGDLTNHNVASGSWVVQMSAVDPFPTVHTNTQYEDRYIEITTPVLTLAAGYALTPSITGSGGTANVAVDLDTTLSGTGYEASAVLAGTSALLADLAITAVTVTDANTVTVTVQNNGLIALAGATVIVTAGELT